MIAETQTGDLVRQFVAESAREQGIAPGQLTLHSDNGTPMKGKLLVSLLDELGIDRPHRHPMTTRLVRRSSRR